MISTILSFIAGLIEKLGWQWWEEHKTQEVQNARSEVDSLSDSELDKRVYDDITRK